MNYKELYKVLSALLCIWLIFIAYKTLTWNPVPMGESDDYMFSATSMQHSHTLGVDEEDFEWALKEYPTFAEYLTENYPDGLSPMEDDTSGRLPYYFPTYSVVVLPIKIIIGKLGGQQIFCFPITNYLLYLLPIFVALKLFEKSLKNYCWYGY